MNEGSVAKNKNRILGAAGFYKGALAIAIPIMLQQLIQSMVSLIDNFMVSGLGDVSMSGVNVAGQVLFVFMVFLNTICMAGGIFMTQFYGAKDREGLKQAFRFKLMLGFAAFIPYFLVCIVFPRQVLSLMLIGNTQADMILDEAVKYIRIMFFIGIPMTLSMCIASSLRDMGRVRFPLIVTIIATLTNTLFNFLLIYGNLGFPKMGVKGAAVATVIARSLEFLIFMTFCIRKKPEFVIKLKEVFRIDKALFKKILKKAALVLFCEMVWVLSETVTTAIYNGRGGADVVSGMASSFAIANLFFVAFGGIYSATGVILGKTLGEGNLERARQEKNWLLSGAIVFSLFVTVFALLTTFVIPIVFGRLSASAVLICKRMVIMMALFTPVWIFLNTQQAVARAGGDTEMGAYTDATITIFVMMPLLFGLGIYTDIGPVEMYGCIKLLDLVKVVVFHIWLKKERWLKNLTEKQ
ncbi:MAG: MATE family efflux transporter [Lachnospiraceae bacterium]|nr:MATE family efflux transporter [Lachnospiraceae bacterium]